MFKSFLYFVFEIFGKDAVKAYMHRNRLVVFLCFTNTMLFFSNLYFMDEALFTKNVVTKLKADASYSEAKYGSAKVLAQNLNECKTNLDNAQESLRKLGNANANCAHPTPPSGKPHRKPEHTPPKQHEYNSSILNKLDAIR